MIKMLRGNNIDINLPGLGINVPELPGLSSPPDPIDLPRIQEPSGQSELQEYTGHTGHTRHTKHTDLIGQGQIGLTGPQGLTGFTGIINFADFYALMPGDNSSTVGAGLPILFPQNGPTNAVITRINSGEFNLVNIGIYEVMFQVSITEPGQLVIVLNNNETPTSICGRNTGASQIIGMSLIQTSVINSILSINNPIGSSTALTITPFAGGGIYPVSAHLIIKQIG